MRSFNYGFYKASRPQVNLFGIWFDAVTRDYLEHRIDEAIAHKIPTWLTFINVAILMRVVKEANSRQLVESADYRLCDGRGIIYASHLLRKPLPEMVSGPYLLFRLLKRADDRNYRIYLVGSKPKIIERAVLNIQRDYPGIILAGYNNGYFSSKEESSIVNQICKGNAHILFVGMGFPRERLFIEKWRKHLNVPVIMDVGGAFTVLAGFHKLARPWVSKVCLEWVYRLAQEPSRLWKRYLITNAQFAWHLLRELIK